MLNFFLLKYFNMTKFKSNIHNFIRFIRYYFVMKN